MMTNGQKIGFAIGGIVIAAGIGFGIYYVLNKKSVVSDNNNNTGGDNSKGGGASTNSNFPEFTPVSAPGSTKKAGGSLVDKLLDATREEIKKLTSYSNESFPLSAGMKGNNVKKLQDALRSKFNQLAVASDGFFGIKTFDALLNIGYFNSTKTTLSKSEFDNILLGVKKS